jgi:hypothetical protein
MKPTYRTPWERRLTPKSPYTAKCPSAGSNESELTLSFENEDTGVGWELEVTVFAEYEPAQNGGRTDPSWDAHFHSPSAYYFRPGHGWKEVSLSDSQEEQILQHFSDSAAEDHCDYDDDRYDDRDYDHYCY